MISWKSFLPVLSLSILSVFNACEKTPSPKVLSKPNIILILADDFGVGDIQAHYPQNKIPTPYLDQLVKEGISFTDAHSSSAVCSPTRYGLLTGRYNWRTPLQEWVLASFEPPLIKSERKTLAEMLKEDGYATACIGKWHLGWNWQGERASERLDPRNVLSDYQWEYDQPISGGPLDHGFDYYFGTHVPNFPPFTYIENDRILIQPTDTFRIKDFEGEFMPRRFDGQAMAPDWEFKNILPGITEKAVTYIKEQSSSASPFFLYFSMTSPHEPVSPSENFEGKSGIAPIADFVMETDWSVGQLLEAVKEAGIEEETLIIFTADNGHSHYTGWDLLLEAGHKASGPFRGHKSTIWEGGHRVPFIAKWKGKIADGDQSDQLICLTDIYASLYELLHAKEQPSDEGEDSFSFLSILMNKASVSAREDIVNHSVHGEFAYRKDGWKLVFKLPEKNLALSRGKAAIKELYHLEEDIAESSNVIDQHPDIAIQLEMQLKEIIERGSSREGNHQANDVRVIYDTIQIARWANE